MNGPTFSERFQRMAERVALRAGAWQHVLFWLVLILCWAALGPSMHYSDSWQLLVNTPTTVFELFLELTILAGQSRQERGKEEILSQNREILARLEAGQQTLIAAQESFDVLLRQQEQQIVMLEQLIGKQIGADAASDLNA